MDDPGILYVSMHQEHFYPFEGAITDVHRGAVGTTLNIPLRRGTTGLDYRTIWDRVVIPVTTAFEADWVLVSCGFDAHQADPLADLELVAADYGAMAASLASIWPANRLLLALEGGYSLEGLRQSAAATARGLAGVEMPTAGEGTEYAQAVIAEVSEELSRYWPI